MEKLHNEEFCNMFSLPNILRMTKSRRMRWQRCAVQIREMRNTYIVLAGKPEWKEQLGRSLYGCGRMISKFILRGV